MCSKGFHTAVCFYSATWAGLQLAAKHPFVPSAYVALSGRELQRELASAKKHMTEPTKRLCASTEGDSIYPIACSQLLRQPQASMQLLGCSVPTAQAVLCCGPSTGSDREHVLCGHALQSAAMAALQSLRSSPWVAFWRSHACMHAAAAARLHWPPQKSSVKDMVCALAVGLSPAMTPAFW